MPSNRRWMKRLPIAVLGLATAGALGLAWVVDRFGQVERARKSPVIVVLGARVSPDGTASAALRARVEKAVELYRQGLAPRLLFSGGVGTYPPAEANAARAVALRLGVPESDCLIETDSHSTQENARFSARLLRTLGAREAIVVSDPYHLLRARQYFYREGIEAHPSPALRAERNLQPLDRAYWTLREALALLVRPRLLLARAPADATPLKP